MPPDARNEWPFAPGDRPSKIVCIGRNWAEHARELGNPIPEEPILFLKPPSALLSSGDPIRLPTEIGRIDHEIELGVVLGRPLRQARPEETLDAVAGWCLALDLTARDLQSAAKRAGRPWTASKGRDGFCPVSKRIPRGDVDPGNARLILRVDGAVRQEGNTGDMLFPVDGLLSHASHVMTLEPGDLILCGTPPGVGPLTRGERVEGLLDGRLLLEHSVL